MIRLSRRQQQFSPQLLVIETGTALEFPNHDATSILFSSAKTFEIRLCPNLPDRPPSGIQSATYKITET